MSMSILCCTNKCFYFVLLETFPTTFHTLSRNLSSRLTPSITNCFINSYAFSINSFKVIFSSLSFWFSYITSISFSSRAVQHRNIMSPICMPDVWSFLWARMQNFVIRRLKTGPRICTI